MEHFEDQLKRALTHRDPPPDFTAKVMARVKPEPRTSWWAAWRPVMAAGLACVMIAGAGFTYHQREERRRGEAARAQLMQALRITSVQLNRAGRVLGPSAHRMESE